MSTAFTSTAFKLTALHLAVHGAKSTRCFPLPIQFSAVFLCCTLAYSPASFGPGYWGTSLSVSSSKAARKNSNGGNTEVKGLSMKAILARESFPSSHSQGRNGFQLNLSNFSEAINYNLSPPKSYPSSQNLAKSIKNPTFVYSTCNWSGNFWI